MKCCQSWRRRDLAYNFFEERTSITRSSRIHDEVTSDAATASDTDWAQIVQLYDHLYALTPTSSSRSTARSPRSPRWTTAVTSRWSTTWAGTLLPVARDAWGPADHNWEWDAARAAFQNASA